MATNKIGQYSFDNIRGWPQLPREVVMHSQRSGYDGTALMLMGKKAAPFQIETVTFLDGVGTAITRFKSYLELCKQDPVDATIHGVASQTVRFKVLDVVIKRNKLNAKVVGAGGLGSGVDGAKLECLWTLIAVKK